MAEIEAQLVLAEGHGGGRGLDAIVSPFGRGHGDIADPDLVEQHRDQLPRPGSARPEGDLDAAIRASPHTAGIAIKSLLDLGLIGNA